MDTEPAGETEDVDSLAAVVALGDRKRSPQAAMTMATLARKEDVIRILPAVLSMIKGGGHTMPPIGAHVLRLLHKLDPAAIEKAQKDLWDDPSRRLQAVAFNLLRHGIGRSELAWNLSRARDLLALSDEGQRYALEGWTSNFQWPEPKENEIRLWLEFFDSLTDVKTFGHHAFERASEGAFGAAWAFHCAGAPWPWLRPLARRFAVPDPAEIPIWSKGGSGQWLRLYRSMAPPEETLEVLRSDLDAAIVHVQKDITDSHQISGLVNAYLEVSAALVTSEFSEAKRLAEEAVLAAQILLDSSSRGLSAEARAEVHARAVQHLIALQDGRA